MRNARQSFPLHPSHPCLHPLVEELSNPADIFTMQKKVRHSFANPEDGRTNAVKSMHTNVIQNPNKSQKGNS
jgi:hypothetical protein